MRILLDTHIWLWALADSAAIPPTLRDRLRSKRDTFFISAASAWDIAVKARLGRLRLPIHPRAFLRAAIRDLPVAELPVSVAHAARVAELPLHHRDPLDRMLIAQAQTEGLAIMTVDRAFDAYGVLVVG